MTERSGDASLAPLLRGHSSCSTSLRNAAVTSKQAALIVRAKSTETVSGNGATLWLLADGSDCCGALGANRIRLEPGTAGAKSHYHEHSAEAFYVLEGVLEMVIDGEQVLLGKGDYAVVPAGVVHSFAAASDTVADTFVTVAPGVDRFEYFRLLPSIMRGELGKQALEKVHQRFDVHFT
jgi:mannose-6-phosphate isomerase-like protein (cupin superfamily)